MPSVPKRVHVVKIGKSNDGVAVAPIQQKVMPEFDRMPRMYLELLENKDKIRPHLVNKEYDPEDASSVYSFDVNPAPAAAARSVPRLDSRIEEEDFEDEEDEDEDDADEEDGNSQNDAADDEEDNVHADEVLLDMNNDDDDNHDDNHDDAFSEASGSTQLSQPVSETSLVSSTGTSDKSVPTPSARKTSSSSVGSSRSSSRSFRPPLTSKEEEVKNRTKQKLKDLLFSDKEGATREVPTLAELKKRGEVKDSRCIPDLNRMEGDKMEEEDELKRELLFKFGLLKKSYKHVNVPEFTMHSDYKNMNQTYENTLRQVSLDSNVESYKSLLVGGFMLLEFILGFWLKFDMSGFTQQQILNMNQYERLLIELGEKSYVPGGSQWPVEVRLLGLIVMNAIIFIISKMILKKTGSNLVGLMNSVNTVMGSAAQKPKRRMRGPSVDLESIPDVNSQE
jgi:hypothetical protein